MSELQEAVRRYGRRPLILHARGKQPVARGWQHGESPATRALNLSRFADGNVGVLCGDGLAVVDVDARAGGFETLAALERERGPLPDSYAVLTGGGGRHVYLRSRDRSLPTAYVGAGLEIRARGAQVVAPPSRHASGRLYVPDPGAAGWGTFAAMPRWLEALADKRQERPPARARTVHEGDFLDSLTPRRYAFLLAGIVPDRAGFALCPSPLHPPERSPSLRLYDTPEAGWTCFRGCCRKPDGRHAGGRIFDLAAHVLGFSAPLRGRDFLAIREAVETKLATALGVEL